MIDLLIGITIFGYAITTLLVVISSTKRKKIEMKTKKSSGNPININLIKESWNREEVEELCKSSWIHGNRDQEETFFDWIKENLK